MRFVRLLLLALVASLAGMAVVPLVTYAYDAPTTARVEDVKFGGLGATQSQLSVAREESVSPSVDVRGSSTTSSLAGVATKAACSFSGDTDVLMADGTRKRIDEVEVGDMVVATDPEIGETKAREVVATLPHEDQLVTLETSAGEVVTTEDHRYWNVTDGEWQAAQDLDPGDQLLTASGVSVVVEGLDWSTFHTTTAYDLDVEGIDTFYVGAGTEDVLVHNCEIAGLADDYIDITRKGSVRNVQTSVNRSSFEQNLIDAGYKPTVAPNGPNVVTYELNGARYVVRDAAKSTGGPTADFYPAGSRDFTLKIRLVG